MSGTSFKKLLPALPVIAAAVFGLNAKRANATDATTDMAERNAKCATRLAIAMIGERAADGATFDTLVKDAKFQERFARFANSQMNNSPGQKPAEDASYYLAKYVLENDKAWSEMFVGKYDVSPVDPNKPTGEAQVTDDPDGLGYFHSRAWMVRYAGNESAGIRIVTAYRMMQNTLGLQLTATTNSPDVDLSANGRKAPQCAGCHYNPWFALDNTASVLGTRKGTGDDVTFDPPTGGAKSILGGVMISNDRELAEALVANEAFDVNACRLAFKYLYGRVETSCEGPAFDQCVADFKKDKKITSALRAVATDANFCE
jgi:hypothetical protein